MLTPEPLGKAIFLGDSYQHKLASGYNHTAERIKFSLYQNTEEYGQYLMIASIPSQDTGLHHAFHLSRHELYQTESGGLEWDLHKHFVPSP